MTDSEASRFKFDRAMWRPALPWLIGILVLLALWLAWSGVQQWRDGARLQTLTTQRDAAAAATAKAIAGESRRLLDQLGQPTVKAALQANDLVGAATRIGAGWPGLQRVEVLPTDLQAAYDGLPQGGYGRLATIEAAQARNAPVARVVADKGAPHFVLAAVATVE